MLRSTHFAFAGIWLGCIIAELIVGRALLTAGEAFRVRLSQLHWTLAAGVEAPAALGVLATGASMLGAPHGAGLGFQIMVTVGLLTIFLGVFKVWLSHKRLAAARRNRWASHDMLNRFQRMLGGVVLLGVCTAIVAGAAGHSAA